MHNNFLDKKRRNLRLQPDQVELVLPEHFQASYPKFISLLKFYYEFQNEEKATELLHHLFAARDITETDIELLSYIEDELLLGDSYFESFATGDAAKRAAANFSSTLFRAKGTLFAIQWFFRSFYNLDAEVTQTKENVFIVGDEASTIGTNSLRFLTDDKLYQTFAYLVRTEVPITKWGELFKLFVHPAGMYLGSALLIQDKVLESLLSEDSDEIIETRTTPSYLYQNNTGSSAEGTTFTINLLGTNVPNDTGIFSWYIENVTTDSSDFAFSEDSDFPDVNNKRQVLMADDGGTVKASITIPTLLDSDESEGTESFRVYFEDPEGREIPNVLSSNVPYINVALTDVVSSYVINPIVGDSNVDEGDLITLHITGTNVPNNGNTNVVVRTYATGSAAQGTDSADEDDFVSFPTTDTIVPITNSVGTFTLQTKVDNHSPAEDTERVSFGLLTQSGIVKDSCFVDINNISPTFNFGNPDDITYDLLVTEGDDIVVRLQVDSTTVGETIEYTINNGGDTRVQTTSGQFEITGTDANYTLSGTSVTDTYDSSNMTYTMNTLAIGDGGSFGPDQLSDTKVIQLRSQDPTFTADVDQVGLGEGTTARFILGGTNIPNGWSAKYYIAHGSTDAADFSGSPPFSVGSAELILFVDDSANVDVSFASNTDTPDDNADENFTFTVIDSADNVVATLPYTIIGASTYSITTPAGVTEGNEEVVAEFETDNAAIKTAGQAYYYVEGANITSSDFTSGYASVSSRSTFTVDGTTGIGQITLDTRQDQRREGAETFKIYVSAGASDGVVASTGNISISDTSLPIYTITMADITEGGTLSCVVTPDQYNTGSEDVYVTFSVTSGAVTFGDATPLPQTLSAISGAKTFTTTTSVNSIYYSGGSTVQADVRVGSYTGTQIGTVTATVDNAAPVYTLTTNKFNDSANEGDTIQFTFGGTNVESKIYTWSLSDIKRYRPTDYVTGNFITSGSNVIYFSSSYDVTQINVGDEIRGQDAGLAFDSEATVTFVNQGGVSSTYVTMSENASVTYTNGNFVYFAAPEVWENYGAANTSPAADDGKPYGQFTHTSGSTSTFDLIVTDTNDVADPSTFSQTMRVYDGDITLPSGSLLKSKTFTIYDGDEDPTPNVQRGTLTDPDDFFSLMRGADAICEIRFLSDGSIEVGKEINFGPQFVEFSYTDFGDWVDNTDVAVFDPSEFEIKATKVSETTVLIATTVGDFGVWSSLDNNQSWKADADVPSTASTSSNAEVEIEFQIREKSPFNTDNFTYTGNSVSFTVTIEATSTSIDR